MRVTKRWALGVLGGMGEYVNIRICPPPPKERHTHAPKRSEIENKCRIRIINKIILFPGCIPDHTPAALDNTVW
jgi:hypothetical protein